MSSYYTVTSLVGGDSPGSYSPDIYYMASDAHSTLNATHPIQQITVFLNSRGPQSVIDGLTVIYNLEGGNTAVMNHGNTSNPSSGVVSFGENEVLATVDGHAGLYAWYRAFKVGSIAFVLYDTKTQESRTVGPFGDTSLQSFSVSEVLAFGSIGDNTVLSGLVFFKNPSNSVDTGASNSTN